MIILASNSFLRKKIMQKSGMKFRVVVPEVDERKIEQDNPKLKTDALVKLLALKKATTIAKLYPNDTIIAADTVAVLKSNGELLHKPIDRSEAISLCLKQSNQTIWAISGYCVVKNGKIHSGVTKTTIKYVKFDEDEILKLLENDDPKIRNSGLGFFVDAPGFSLVESFKGSYLGAMGLPLEKIRSLLKT